MPLYRGAFVTGRISVTKSPSQDEISFSCFWGSTKACMALPHMAWHAPRHRNRSLEQCFGIGTSTDLPPPPVVLTGWPAHKPEMPQTRACFAPSFVLSSKQRRPRRVHISTESVSCISSFGFGVHFSRSSQASRIRFFCSSGVFPAGMLSMARMMSPSVRAAVPLNVAVPPPFASFPFPASPPPRPSGAGNAFGRIGSPAKHKTSGR